MIPVRIDPPFRRQGLYKNISVLLDIVSVRPTALKTVRPQKRTDVSAQTDWWNLAISSDQQVAHNSSAPMQPKPKNKMANAATHWKSDANVLQVYSN